MRRPVRPFTGTVQAFLRHLWAQGVEFVPEPLAYDDQGREVLRFVPGDVPLEPLPDWATTETVFAELGRLIRKLHDASAEWAAPPDAVWGRIPGVPLVELPPLFDAPELVSHQDYCPGNVVFRQGLPKAFIDFDLARPTTRVADCVNALYWWVPLLDPLDRPPSLTGGRRWTSCARLRGCVRNEPGAASTGTPSCGTPCEQHAHHDARCG